MTQRTDGSSTWMFTTEQVRRMLPDGASDSQRAIGTRCKRAGATYLNGWPVKEIEQVTQKREVVSIEIDDEPIEVYTFAQVFDRVGHLGWFMSESTVRWRLQEAGVRSHRGYSPPEKVREAMQRPAGRDWRNGIKGNLAGRKFT